MSNDGQNRRHIRDIAHLYLSGASSRRFGLSVGAGRRPLTLFVAGADRDCLPGFHVANLAAAIRARGYRVSVVERSGTLPNAAYFLAMPARVYLAGPYRFESEWISAMDGIRVAFATPGQVNGHGGGEVRIVHLPPLRGGEDDHVEVHTDPAPIVVIASARTGSIDEALMERYGTSPWRAIMYADRVPDSPPHGFVDLGVVPTWRNLVTDRVPAVMRDPDARVSRWYKTACDELLGRAQAPVYYGSSHGRSVRNAGAERSV